MSGNVERVVVVGGGIMGNGIAQVVATAGLEVTIVDISQDALDKTRVRIGRSLDRLVARERISRAEADAVLDRIATSTDLAAAASGADHAIETVVEDLAIKGEVLRRLTPPVVTRSSSPRTPRSSRSPSWPATPNAPIA